MGRDQTVILDDMAGLALLLTYVTLIDSLDHFTFREQRAESTGVGLKLESASLEVAYQENQTQREKRS